MILMTVLFILLMCGALVAAGVGVVWVICALVGWAFDAHLAVVISLVSLLIGTFAMDRK